MRAKGETTEQHSYCTRQRETLHNRIGYVAGLKVWRYLTSANHAMSETPQLENIPEDTGKGLSNGMDTKQKEVRFLLI